MLTLIGGQALNNLRKSILYKVERGLWRETLGAIVSVHGKVSTHGFNFNRKVDPDEDDYEAQLRRRFYTTAMQLFAKVAGRTEMQVMYEPWLLPLWNKTQTYSMYIWNQLLNMDRELEPFQLVAVIRLTKKATSLKLEHIPRF